MPCSVVALTRKFIMERDEEIIFPPFENFVEELLSYFQPTNMHQDAAHQLGLLKQGNKTAGIITEFQLLISLAGYSATTTSNHLHLIEKLRSVLNPSLVKKVMLLDSPPTTIDGWVQKAITVDSQHCMTMDILGGMNKKTDNKGGRFNDTRKTNYSDYFKTRKYRDEKKDNDAMDIDARSTKKRITLMKKGAFLFAKNPDTWLVITTSM